MKGFLLAILIVMLIFSASCVCDYVLTKKALTDLRGEEPKTSTVIWVMLHGDNARARVEK